MSGPDRIWLNVVEQDGEVVFIGTAWLNSPAPCEGEAIAYLRADLHEAELSRLRSQLKTARDALEPFVRAFLAKTSKGSPSRRKWNDEMPGEWPIELSVSMNDGRRARAALVLIDEPRGGEDERA